MHSYFLKANEVAVKSALFFNAHSRKFGNMKKLLLFLPVFFFLFSCKKKTEAPVSETAQTSVKLKVHHLWDAGTDFQLNTMLVNPLNGDSLQFGIFKYYLSNLKLKRDNGTWWEMPDSYFIVDAATPQGCSLDLGNVPAGSYTAIKYTLGVDSTHNVSGSQSGALDPANAMFWSWTSGYIMLLTEGTSPDISQESAFSLHMTGYLKPYSIIDEITHSFPATLDISAATPKTIVISANPAYLWQSGPVSTYHSISGAGATTRQLANGFHSTFSFEGFE